MIRNDVWIAKMVAKHNMIEPFEPKLVSDGVISYGLGSLGYDARLSASCAYIPSTKPSTIPPAEYHSPGPSPRILDPKNSQDVFAFTEGLNTILIDPGQFLLVHTVERFSIPRSIMAFVYGKSTYARCGIIIHTTPLEPGWRGTITLEIVNVSTAIVPLYIGEGFVQVVFMSADRPSTSYADRHGKYQDQR